MARMKLSVQTPFYLSSSLGLFTSRLHFRCFVSLILMADVFPSSFHQRMCLYLLVAISAELITWAHSSAFSHECELVSAQRHDLLWRGRRSNLQRVCIEKLLLALGLALGRSKAAAFLGQQLSSIAGWPCACSLLSVSCSPRHRTQCRSPSAAQWRDYKVRPVLVLMFKEMLLPFPLFLFSQEQVTQMLSSPPRVRQ